MSFPFTPAEKQELRELLGLPSNFGPASVPTRLTLPIDDVRHVLDLPEPGYRELLTRQRWLAGGGPLRWLCHGRLAPTSHGDYDLYLPSLEAVNRTVHELVEQGFHFRCFRSWVPFCPRCGGDAERYGLSLDGLLPLAKIRCPTCGELGEDAERHEVRLPVEVDEELVAARRLMVVELVSPRDEIIHLSTMLIRPSPQEVIAGFDYSIAQFALDSDHVYGTRYAWTDLLLGRIRIAHPAYHSYPRLRKYQALGFRPYAGTVVRVLLRNVAPGLRALFQSRSQAPT